MLESGLALIACCLPTLNALVRLPALQSIVRSVRDIASFGSYGSRSQRSQRLDEGPHSISYKSSKREMNGSMTSQTAFVPEQIELASETYAIGGVPKTFHEVRETPGGRLRVDKTVEQRNSMWRAGGSRDDAEQSLV